MIQARAALHNPVVGKELRTRMRSWRSLVLVTAYMGVLAIIAVGFLIQQTGPRTSQTSQVGVQLFQVLAAFQLFLILFITPASIAGAISGERQRQTWDLLRVTRLSTFSIVWGKLLAGLAFNVLLIFASLPLFSLVFLFGGVAPVDVIHVYIVFLATVLLLGTTSLFISVLTRRLATSMIVSDIVALTLGVGVTLMTLALENWNAQQYVQQYSPIAGQGVQTTPPAALSPLAQLDPFVALASALPNSSGSSFLGDLGTIHNAFALPVTMHFWSAFTVLSVVVSAILLTLTTYGARSTPRWLGREAA